MYIRKPRTPKEAGQELLRFLNETHPDPEYCNLLMQDHPDFDPAVTDAAGMTALMSAAFHGQYGIMEYIMDNANPDINARDHNGHTALMHVIQGDRHEGRAGMVRSLIEAGADMERESDLGIRPLTAAIFSSDADIVRILLEHHCNITKEDGSGRTPLQQARNVGRENIVDMIAAEGRRRTTEAFRAEAAKGTNKPRRILRRKTAPGSATP
ncbi:MAG: ankyrin repeat domain-containing protein [Alphaproteobacteria bacterium]|nr:ankyrin repeat domain-containing protein [Alphaproteobacteria bacterium]